jgi:uncharacterized protein (TIGR03435 family)
MVTLQPYFVSRIFPLALVLTLLGTAAHIFAQQSDATGPSVPVSAPHFEVASIRLAGKTCDIPLASLPPTTNGTGRFTLPCMSTAGFIAGAYVAFADGLHHSSEQVPIENAPAWVTSDLYNVQAAAEGNPTRSMMNGPMLRSVLEDRFRLKVHFTTREVPVYALTMSKGASKLKPFKEGSCLPVDFNTIAPRSGAKPAYCQTMVGPRRIDGALVMFVDMEGVTLDELCKRLSATLDRPVVDKTGQAGLFEVHLRFSGDEMMTAQLVRNAANAGIPIADASKEPTLSIALQEQLGLKLERTKGPGKFLVIDHIERPSEN